jgi:hypothetical protein
MAARRAEELGEGRFELLRDQLERLAPGVSGASNALIETFRSCSSYSRSCSRLSRLRRRTVDKPLEKRQH